MNGKQLCEALSIDRRQLNAWLKEGLPFEGTPRRRTFDAEQVAAWLIEKGYAEPADTPAPAEIHEQPILRTRNEVAQHFGVSLRTVATWITEGMPGEPGSPGRRDGYFPLEAITAWMEARRMPIDAAADNPERIEGARLKRARASMIELELAEKQGNLVDAAEASRQWIRAIHEAKTQADQLPAWLAKRLPDTMPADQRKRIRVGLKRRLAEIYRTLELALRAQADELEAGAEHGSSDGESTDEA